jgi:hypothetical protein
MGKFSLYKIDKNAILATLRQYLALRLFGAQLLSTGVISKCAL